MIPDFVLDIIASLQAIIANIMGILYEMEVPALIEFGIFAAISGVIVIGALGVVVWRNLVHSALSLTLAFVGLGCLYISLSADFLGAVQIMVYGGAVSILLVMGIMFTRRDDMAHSNPSRTFMSHLVALPVAGSFLGMMTLVLLFTPFKEAPVEVEDTAAAIADLMLTKYMLPFEIVAVLLLVALVGAIILAKGVDEA